MKREITIYVLELENDFFYVGKTYNIKNRLKQHSKGKGSAWTTFHLFKRLLKQYTFDIEKPEDEEYWENFITLKFMKEKGWKKVRGGFWCNIGEYETIKNLQAHKHFLRVKVDEIKFQTKKYIIYALSLENGKFFIGYTTNFDLAQKSHFNGKSSEWTKTYKPIEVIDTWNYESENGKIDMNFVDEKVHIYFEKYSAINVRGGSYIVMNHEIHLKKAGEKVPENEIIDEIKFQTKNYIIYAFSLEDNKFFIGYTTNLKLAEKNHLKGKASKWTKMYKPIKIIETWNYESKNGKIDMAFVDEKVHLYFEKYSAINIRGGSYIIMDDELHLNRAKKAVPNTV